MQIIRAWNSFLNFSYYTYKTQVRSIFKPIEEFSKTFCILGKYYQNHFIYYNVQRIAFFRVVTQIIVTLIFCGERMLCNEVLAVILFGQLVNIAALRGCFAHVVISFYKGFIRSFFK